jgi:hypothetical protein
MRISILLALALVTVTGCSRGAAQSHEPSFTVVANVEEVMEGIVVPASNAVFDAVVYSNGELLQAPKTDDDWLAVRAAGLALAESGNLLLMPPRAKDAGDWTTFSHQLTDAAVTAARAAEAHDLDALLRAGGTVYNACTACHTKYIPRPTTAG